MLDAFNSNKLRCNYEACYWNNNYPLFIFTFQSFHTKIIILVVFNRTR